MDDACIFCRIASGAIPATLLYADEQVVAFPDVNPQAPTHVLVIPRRHLPRLSALPGSDPLWNRLLAAVQAVAESLPLAGGFRLVVNQGGDGGQTVEHLHLHVLGGRQMTWPPG
jgi:histidine triad (HIT) family protein